MGSKACRFSSNEAGKQGQLNERLHNAKVHLGEKTISEKKQPPILQKRCSVLFLPRLARQPHRPSQWTIDTLQVPLALRWSACCFE